MKRPYINVQNFHKDRGTNYALQEVVVNLCFAADRI
jgi:hypothetical protein